VTNAGKTGCVVGLSGGIDSAVIVSLCKLAFPNTTYGIYMPMRNNVNGDSHKRAVELSNLKKIKSILRSIPVLEGGYSDKAKGNYHARRRMSELYLFAEENDSLVIGTDNACENYIGFFTKHGDGGVDINPLGKFLKSEVFELGVQLKVPASIIKATPSAELWNGQTDEDEMGFTYEQLESYIKCLNGKGLKHCGLSSEIMNKIKLMHELTQHKRELPAECPKNC